MALVDDDKIKEVRGILTEIRRWLAVFRRAAHERLKNREEDASIGWHSVPSPNLIWRNPHQGILGESRKGVVCLVGENVPVREEEDARATRRFAAQVPAAVEKFPRNLKRNERFARAGGEREQNTRTILRNGLHHPLDGNVLVITARRGTTPVLGRHRGDT